MVALARFISPRQHDRLLCHWGIPFKNSLSKARDPYINRFTLMRHLKSKDANTRNAAAENILKRQLSRWNVELFEAVLEGEFSDQIKDSTLIAICNYLRPYAKALPRLFDGDPYLFKLIARQPIEIIEKFHDLWMQGDNKMATLPEPYVNDKGGKEWPMKIEYEVGHWTVDKADRMQPVYRNETPVKLFENSWRYNAYSPWYQVGYMIADHLFMF